LNLRFRGNSATFPASGCYTCEIAWHLVRQKI
jgi:hypothetical protein